ncbi:MAG: hypothetical protein HZA53_00755 [Planctomycetes bacterium]|nr:hypothetical protein [Planctomycetota bacterium]
MHCQPIRLLALPAFAALAAAQNPHVIYSEVTTSPSSTVPGALDAAGLPVATTWLAIEDLRVRPDGAQWCIKGRTTQATTNDAILVLGGGVAGTMFLQDGQPVQGGAVGEQYDFFDSPNPVSWDSAGNLGLSFRAKGGVANTLEKIAKVVAGVHTIVLKQGDPLTGLVDVPANPTGDEQLGNSVGSVQLRDDGTFFYGVTPIQNCSSLRYPGLFHQTSVGFRQSGVSTIGAEVWDSFVYDGCGSTADGLHWFARGDTENTNTTIDNLLVVDDVVVMQENSPVVPGGPLMNNVLFVRMLPSGSWYARGQDFTAPTTGKWAVRDGVLLAKTGDLIAGAEHWSTAFIGFHGNAAGHWVLSGSTDEPNTAIDNVLVYDGTTVLAREGDPVALENDGVFDDDAFITSFQPDDLFLTDDGRVYFLVTLRNGAGTVIGDAFLRLAVGPQDGAFCAGDGVDPDVTTACPCGNTGSAGNGCANSVNAAGANLAASGTTNPDTMVLAGSGMPATVSCIFLQGDTPTDVLFGDGVRCAGGALVRLRTRANVGGASSFPDSTDTITLSARGGVTPGSGAVRLYQTYYRNSAPLFCPPETFNVTNGWRLTW